MGALSYPLYLNHYVAGTVVASLWPTPGIGRLLVASVAAFVLAYAMERGVDPLLVRMRERIRRHAPGSSPPATEARAPGWRVGPLRAR